MKMDTFGSRLKELRNGKGLSQEELAKAIHLAQSTIAYYESEKKNPSKQTIQLLSDFFSVSTDYLLGKSNIRNPYIPEEYKEKYEVAKKDVNQYEEFMSKAGAFFMDDKVSEDDKEALFRDISEIFWKSKEINKKKYGRKKQKDREDKNSEA